MLQELLTCRANGRLLLTAAGLLLGIAIAPDLGYWRFFEIASALVAFYAGYFLFSNSVTKRAINRWIVILTFPYVVVCALALSRVAPNIFPVEIALWSDGLNLIERPAITTDQNFQVFYFFPLVFLPWSTTNWRWGVISLLPVVLAFSILAELQTRSGTLVFLGGILLGLMSVRRLAKDSLLRLSVYGTLLLVGLIFFLDQFFVMFEGIHQRVIGDHRAAGTAIGRLNSLLYLFEKLWNPIWWIPQGNEEFQLYHGGNRPHSNFTALFLEGGIMALIGWVTLSVVPLIALFRVYRRKEITTSGLFLLVIGSCVFVLQLSLNLPVMDQVWLWTGAVNGYVYGYLPRMAEVINGD